MNDSSPSGPSIGRPPADALRFARGVFLVGSIYGVLMLVPGFFTETLFNVLYPPPVTHPEFYYGFFGTALAFQVVYFLISRDPVRYRPLMAVAVFAKLTFFGACVALAWAGRLALGGPFYGSLGDGILMVLFLIAFVRTSRVPDVKSA